MATTKKVKRRRPLTPQQWDQVRIMYLNGTPVEDIVDSFPEGKVSAKTIYNRMCKEGLSEKRQAIQDRVMDHAVERLAEEKIRVNNACIDLFMKGAQVIDQLLTNCLTENAVGSKKKGEARSTAYNIDLLMSGTTKVQKGLRVAYEMDADGKLREVAPEILTIEGINTDKI